MGREIDVGDPVWQIGIGVESGPELYAAQFCIFSPPLGCFPNGLRVLYPFGLHDNLGAAHRAACEMEEEISVARVV
jgi:hypothetical protein